MNKSKTINLALIISISLIFLINGATADNPSTGDTITSIVEDGNSDEPNYGRIFEISPSMLDRGYKLNVEKNDVFRILINDKYYNLIVDEIGETVSVNSTVGDRVYLGVSEVANLDVNGDGKPDIFLKVFDIQDRKASLEIKNYHEIEDLDSESEGSYKELFDVEIGLLNDKVYDSKDLSVFMRFTNFGEGLSKIDVTYSIYDGDGNEVYRGVEEKVVYTEESVIKRFDFLELHPGRYSIYSVINYGDNQTADSEESFEILESKPYFGLWNLVLVLVFVICLYFIIFFIKKQKNKQKNIQ